MFEFLLTALNFGFISVLAPVALPMALITVGFFLKQSEFERDKPLLTALVFSWSIMATLIVTYLAMIFRSEQLRDLVNSLWLNIVIMAVWGVFASHMMGLFKSRISGGLAGYMCAICLALTCSLTAFSCTYTFVATLLVAAAQGEFLWPIVGMLAFGSAFASPFFFLALLPSLLKKLSKSRGWLKPANFVAGLALLGVSGNLAVELFTAFTASPAENKETSSDFPEPHLTYQGLTFILDVDKGISHAMKLQRPLFFEFTGVNAVNCRRMEIKMARPQNRSRLEKLVLVQLYVDKVPTIPDRAEQRRLLNRNVDLQIELFGNVTVPTFAVMTPDGKTILSRYFGEEQQDGEFAAFMDEGLKNWSEMSGE